MQDCCHTMTEIHFFLRQPFKNFVGLVAAGENKFAAQHEGIIRHRPGLDMEHRGKRHVDLIGPEFDAVRIHPPGHTDRNSMHEQLPVGEDHPFGITGSAGGIT